MILKGAILRNHTVQSVTLRQSKSSRMVPLVADTEPLIFVCLLLKTKSLSDSKTFYWLNMIRVFDWKLECLSMWKLHLSCFDNSDFQGSWHNSVDRDSGNKGKGIFQEKKKKEKKIKKSFLNSTSVWRWDLIRRKVKHHNTTLENKNRKDTNTQVRTKPHTFTQKGKEAVNPINLGSSAWWPPVSCGWRYKRQICLCPQALSC